ncbi:MAG: two-component sensor histidine kinase [Clostridiales bacterium]|nr:two-component sensor histidine kinase [Clostridiales bacterium]
MLQFFLSNMMIMLVIYTILFFLLGFAIVLKVNKNSQLKLAKSMWLLAGYGFAHGINELVIIVMRVKEAQLTPSMLFAMRSTELMFKAFSFMFIFWLGIRLITDYNEKYSFLKIVGAVISLTWIGMAVYTLGFSENQLYLAVADNLSRYMFAFPGFLLAAIGLWAQIRDVEVYKIPSLVNNLRGLAITFFVGAFIVGMVANEPVLWPAQILNRQTFLEALGVPVIFFRSWFLVFITYFVLRTVDVFEVERECRLEEALRKQVLMNERERFARELHDGIIQSIYGVGLKLEQASILAEKRQDESKKQIVLAKSDLNQVIHDIRDYIQELQPEDFSCVSLREGISQLIREFRESVLLKIGLIFEGQQCGELNIMQINNVLQVLRELLTNAAKHSLADEVQVKVLFKEQDIVIRIDDNGIGFNPESLKTETRGGEKQGLKNIFYRVGMLQGTVVFNTAPGQGTHYEITLPYKKLSYAGGVFVDNPEYFQRVLEQN